MPRCIALPAVVVMFLNTPLQAGVLKGILWHQGESDCNPQLSQVYEQALHELIARLRSELNAPKLPFIAGQMGKFADQPWTEDFRFVDAIVERLPDKVSTTAFVRSIGLTHKGDRIHFDAASYRELGRRYAKAYQDLVSAVTIESTSAE